jgi:hypothetical protein
MFHPPSLPRTLEAALRDLSATAASVRTSAVRDLVPHAGEDRERVIRALEKALRDEAPSVRAVAATSLADVEAVEALPALLLAVEDDDDHVRQMAISALGEIGDARATERLRRALGDKRPEVRFQAVIAFPRVSASREAAVTALMEATRDEDAFVCHIALRMAEELADEEGEVSPALVARAQALLGHDATQVRVASAVLLARAGEVEAASKVLVQIVAGEIATRDGEDEVAAIELAGELGLEAARAGLERRAFGGFLGLRRDRFAWHARVALARMGHERARREIVRELDAWDRDRRTLAVAAVGRARIVSAREQVAAMRGDEGRADPHAVDEALAALAAVGS